MPKKGQSGAGLVVMGTMFLVPVAKIYFGHPGAGLALFELIIVANEIGHREGSWRGIRSRIFWSPRGGFSPCSASSESLLIFWECSLLRPRFAAHYTVVMQVGTLGVVGLSRNAGESALYHTSCCCEQALVRCIGSCNSQLVLNGDRYLRRRTISIGTLN